jgi:mannose-6-phosphate isomerase-like protein (cupin superfamily)
MTTSVRGEEGAPPEPGPIILGPGEGRPIPGREEVVLKATGADTGGAVAVLEATTPPGGRPSPHIHHDNDEFFYVLEGRVRFEVGGQAVDATPGTFVFVPRGTVHVARTIGTETARLLAGFVPAGPERDMEAFARAPRADRDRLARESGSEFVESAGAEPGEQR